MALHARTDARSNPKLQEAILYIASRCDGARNLGTTKLYKILFFAEAESYRNRRTTITNDPYVKRKYGPAPKRGIAEIAALEARGDLVMDTVGIGGSYEMISPIALRDANTSLFAREELAYLDYAIANYSRFSATALSKMTHEMPIWRWAHLNENINWDLLFDNSRVDLAPMSDVERREAQVRHRALRFAVGDITTLSSLRAIAGCRALTQHPARRGCL